LEVAAQCCSLTLFHCLKADMAPPLLNLDGIKLTFGGTPLLDGAGLTASAGDKIALVGRNGSGKSTLLKIAAGLIEPQDGEVFRQPSATVRYLPQMPDMDDFATVRAYVEAGLGPADDPYRATYLMEHLGLSGEERPNDLSGGEARRAALARVMAPEPDILLLDEPTNHLDLSVIEWLEEELARTASALIVISHDRRFLERVSRATVWLDRGQTRRLDKGFGHFEEWRDTVLEEEEREQHKLGRQIVREEHWLRYGVTARRKRNMRRLGELQTMRQRFRGHRGAEGSASLVASDATESGKLVIEAKNIEKSFGDLTVVKGFSTRIQRGDRVGLVGPNGAGKTTLLKMLTGELQPDAGTIRLGTNLEIATLDQKREAVDPQETLAQYLTDGRGENLVINGEQRHVVSYMKDFLFKPEQARTPVKELSGGERARLLLARVLARPANLLVLDQRPRYGNAGAAAGTGCRFRRNGDPGQPRSRFPRPHRDQHHRAGRRRAVDRICRRLFGHAGATRRNKARRPQGESEKRRSRCCRRQANRRRAQGPGKEALVQAEIRAGIAAQKDRGGDELDLAAGKQHRRPRLL
jgi:ATP-binding cassette subfamily F protein uup